MHILLIDDDVRARHTLALLLRRAGVSAITEVEDGQAALAMLETVHPHLVLTDCEMPRMDGLALTRALRARGDRTPVIMLTGQTDPAVAAEAADAGVNVFLLKPLDPAALLKAIHRLLRRSAAA
jgi:DNA-binding response OmpR family regulator